MRVFTCYALTNGKENWLAIDELPASTGKFVNETNRMKLIRQDLLVTIIVIDNSMSSTAAIQLANHCFDHPETWLTVDLKKPVTEVEQPQKARRRGR